jgi:hypothetical protein
MRKWVTDIASWLIILFPLLLVAGHVVPDIALSLIGFFFLVHCAERRDWRWLQARWVQCLLVTWVYIMLRGCFSENALVSLHRSLPWFRYIVFAAALAYWLFLNDTTRNRFFIALTWVILFFALDGLLQWFAGRDILWHARLTDTLGHYRLTGPWNKPILGIMLAWLSFPVCVQFLLPEAENPARRKVLHFGIVLTLLVLATIIVSGERMALLLSLFGWAIAIVMLSARSKAVWLVLACGIALIGLLALISPQVLGRQVNSTIDTLTHWQQSPYGQIFASGLELVKQNPLFGIGSAEFSSSCAALYTDPTANAQACNTHPHNIYMEWLIENGIIGLVLFIAFIAAVIAACARHWRRNCASPAFIGLFIAFMLRVWPIASSTNFFSSWGAPPFWLVLGALLAYTAAKEENDADHTVTV